MEDSLNVANESINNGAFDYIVKSDTSIVKTVNILKNIYKNIIYKRRIRAQRVGLIIALIIIAAFVFFIAYAAKKYNLNFN